MSIRYWNRDVVPGGVEPYEIGMDEPHVGPFAVSYKARRPDGTSVFLKQYKSPSRTVDWYHPYIDYQRELKRRIEGNPTISSRTYDFIDMFEADGAFIQVFGYLDRGDNLRSRIDSGIESPRRRWEFATEFLSATDITASPIAFASPTGTALPICLYLAAVVPVKIQSSGNC